MALAPALSLTSLEPASLEPSHLMAGMVLSLGNEKGRCWQTTGRRGLEARVGGMTGMSGEGLWVGRRENGRGELGKSNARQSGCSVTVVNL